MNLRWLALTMVAGVFLCPLAEAWAKGFSRATSTRAPVARPTPKPAIRPTPKPTTRPSSGSGSYRPPTVSRPSVSKPTFSRPPTSSKPIQVGSRLPQTKPAPRPSTPVTRPATRPSIPVTRPTTRPSIESSLPSMTRPTVPTTRPTTRPTIPTTKPAIPTIRPSTKPEITTRPATKPSIPNRPTTLPSTRPSIGDFIGMKPEVSVPGRPTTLPAKPGNTRPPSIPERPTTLPGFVENSRPSLPGIGSWPERPTTLPGNLSPGDNRPGLPPRPTRPSLPDNWQNIVNNSQIQWNNWRQDNQITINNFQTNRVNNWNNINVRYNERGWASRYGTNDFWGWHGNVWDYRRHRCEEIWLRRRPFWDNCFDYHWWGSCWWRPAHHVHVSWHGSPWWWWRPFVWTAAGAFFGAALSPQPIVYDPGTTVIYEGDT